MNNKPVVLDMKTRRSVKIGSSEPYEPSSNQKTMTGTDEPEETMEEDPKTVYLADSLCESCENLGPVKKHKCRKQLCEESQAVEKEILIS